MAHSINANRNKSCIQRKYQNGIQLKAVYRKGNCLCTMLHVSFQFKTIKIILNIFIAYTYTYSYTYGWNAMVDGWCVSVRQKVLMLNTKCTDIFACKKPTNAVFKLLPYGLYWCTVLRNRLFIHFIFHSERMAYNITKYKYKCPSKKRERVHNDGSEKSLAQWLYRRAVHMPENDE